MLNDEEEGVKLKEMTLDDFMEKEHKENEERELDKPLEKPIQMPTTNSFGDREEVMRSIRMRETERNGKKFLSVSVIYDLQGREIPMEELDSMKHEAEHWLTYLGMAFWQLSKRMEGQHEELSEVRDTESECNPDGQSEHDTEV